MNDIELLKANAERGLADAQEQLGQLFLSGEGVATDVVRAIFWLRQAALQGHEDAQHQLGALCAEGIREAQTDARNAEWLRVAASHVHQLADAYVRTFYADPANVGRSVAEIVDRWQGMARLGNAEAQQSLANLYWFGFGVEENLPEAERWFRSAVNLGSPAAKYRLAEFLDLLETPETAAEALEWWQSAALEGYAPASYQLGMLHEVRSDHDYAEYQTRFGIVPDSVNAAAWFRLAASQGHGDAKASLFLMMTKGMVAPTSDAEEAQWTIAAAGQYSKAQAHLASLYAAGRGVEKDLAKADLLMKRANSPHRGPIRLTDGPA